MGRLNGPIGGGWLRADRKKDTVGFCARPTSSQSPGWFISWRCSSSVHDKSVWPIDHHHKRQLTIYVVASGQRRICRMVCHGGAEKQDREYEEPFINRFTRVHRNGIHLAGDNTGGDSCGNVRSTRSSHNPFTYRCLLFNVARGSSGGREESLFRTNLIQKWLCRRKGGNANLIRWSEEDTLMCFQVELANRWPAFIGQLIER